MTRRSLRLVFALGSLALIAAVMLVRPHLPVREAAERGISLVRSIGPTAFFLAMAFVPAPLAWFTIPAGQAFAGQLTLPGVIGASLASVAVQIALCYLVARYALRPWVERCLKYLGYAIPSVSKENGLAVVLLVRLTPGPPLSIGCALLGLAEVPFGTYMIASWLMTVPWVIGGIILGRGALSGNRMLGFAGAGLLGAALLAVRLMRRRQAVRPATGPLPAA